MSLLQDGYVVDVPYPSFVHRQAMPLWLSTLVGLKGYAAPDPSRPFRYLELGCGMGIHLHLAAASHPQGHFVGVDFNAEHLAVGLEGIEHTKNSNIEFIHTDFQTFLQQDLEPFDFIITHGVWSWVAPEHQNAMVDIIHKLLKPTGILYCSYMSHPGATGLTSIQKLMFEMSRNLKGDSATKAMQGLRLAQQIGTSNIGLFGKIPTLNQDLFDLSQDKPNYIAHDFLAEHWQPQHSADMIRGFGKIGLPYLGAAGLVENIDTLLPANIQKILKTLPLVTLQETVKDIARHTLQRQDVYLKTKQKLTEQQQQQFYQSLKFSLLPNAPVGKNLKEDSYLGQVTDAIPVFEAILKLLAQQQLSFIQIKQKLNFHLNFQQVTDLIFVLISAGYIHPMYSADLVSEKNSERINTWMQQQQLPWRSIAKLGTALEISVNSLEDE